MRGRNHVLKLSFTVLALLGVLALSLTGCGKKKPADPPDPFRDKLSSQGEQVIELNEDTVLAGSSYVVNGTKTITGTGTITAGDMTEDFMLTVANGAVLTLDGITIDGGSKAKSGILVSAGGDVQFVDGEVKNLTRLGLRVEGTAMLAGAITDTGTSWVEVREGGDVVVDGGMLTQSGGVGIQTYKDSRLTIKGDAVLSGSRSNIVFNNGTTDINGAVLTDANMYLLSNNGTMTVANADISKAAAQGVVYNYEGADLTITDSKLYDSADQVLTNSGAAQLRNVTLSGSKGYAVYNEGAKAVLSATDTRIENTEATAFFNRVGSTMTLKNVATSSVDGHGILNRGGTLAVTNYTSEKGGAVVIMNQSATDKDLTYGKVEVDGFKIDTAPGYGILSYGGEMILKNGRVGACGSSGVYIRDGKAELNTVDVLGVKGKDPLPGIQVGHTDTHNTVVTMTQVNISGAYRGINNRGTLTYNSGTISNNHNAGTYKSGGGINNYGTLTINGGTITGNSSVESGGGVFNQGKLTINGGVITGNKSGTSGGGIGNSKSGSLTIVKGDISANRAGKNAGGIYNGGTLTITGGTIKGNTNGKDGTGGGVVNEGTLRMQGGVITANASDTSGGGLFNTSNGTAVLSGGNISANTTGNGKGGGGIYNTGKLTLEGGIKVTDNKSAGGGGAINNAKSSSGAVGTVTITGGTISGNTAGTSGGVIANSANVTITGGTLSKNKATNNGGAVYNTGSLTLGGAAFTGNTAGKNGPDVFNDGGKLTLTNTVKAGVWTNAVMEYNDAFSTDSAVKLSRFGNLKGQQNVARAAAGAKTRDVSAAFITDGTISTNGQVNTAIEARLLNSNGTQKATGTLADMVAAAATGDTVEIIADVKLDQRITLSNKAVSIRDDGKTHTITVTAPNRAFQLNKGSVLNIIGKGGLTFKGATSDAVAIIVNESSTLDMSGKITVTGFNCTNAVDKSGGAFIWNTTTGTTVLDGVTFKNIKGAKSGSAVFSGGGTLTLTNVTASGNSAASGQDVYATGDTKVTINGGSFSSGTDFGGKASIFVNEKCSLTLSGKPNMDITAYKLVTKLDDSFSTQSKVTLYLDGYTNGKQVLTGSAAVIKTAVEAGAFTLPRAAAQTTPKALQTDGTLNKAGSGSTPVVPSGEPEVRLLDSNGNERGTGSFAGMVSQAKNGDIVELFADVTISSRVSIAAKDLTIRDDGTARTITVTAQNRAFQLNNGAKLTITGTQKGGLTFKGSASPASAICVNESSTLTMNGNITVTGFDGSNETDKSGGAFIWNTSTGITVLDGVTFKDNKTVKNGSVVFSGGGTLTLKNITTSGNSAGSGQDIYATGETQVTIDGGSYSSGTGVGGKASIFVNEKCTLTLKGKPVMDITAYKLVTRLADDFDTKARVTLYLDGYTAGKAVLRGSVEVVEDAVKAGAVLLPRAAEQAKPKVLMEDGSLVNADGSVSVTPAAPSNDPVVNLLSADGTQRASGTFAAMLAQANSGDILELFADVTIHERMTISGKSLTIRDDGTARTIKVTSTNRAFQLNSGAKLTITGSQKGGLAIQGKASASVAVCVNSNSTLTMQGNIAVSGFDCANSTDTNGGAFIWNTTTGTTVLDGVTFKDNKSAVAGAAVYSAGGTLKLTNVTASGNSSGSGQDIHATGNTQVTIDGGSYSSGSGKGGKASVFINSYCGLTLKGKPVMDLSANSVVTALADDFDAAARVTLNLDNYTAGKRVLSGSAEVVKAAVSGGAFSLPWAAEQTPARVLQEDGTLALSTH